jgi:hypothetical protein
MVEKLGEQCRDMDGLATERRQKRRGKNEGEDGRLLDICVTNYAIWGDVREKRGGE